MRNEPSVLISGAARIDLFEGFTNGIALVELEGQIRRESGGPISHVARGALRKNEPKRVDGAAAVRVARAIQPEQREGETAFRDIRGLTVGNSKKSGIR